MKKKMFLALIALLVFFLNSGVQGDINFPESRSEYHAYVPGQLVVKLVREPRNIGQKANILPEDILAVKYRSRIKAVQWHPANCYVLETQQGIDVELLKKQLSMEPLVEKVSLNYMASIATRTPNDPMFSYQYALHNTGQIIRPETGQTGTIGSDIKAIEGWGWTIGSEDVIIAIIDTGIALDHEDLINRVIEGYNFVDDNYNSYDDHGHGTFVASIAAAETNNGKGMAGVSWNAKLMPLKAADSEGFASYLAIAAALRYAADQGAHVINISIGGENPSFILEDACRYAYEKGCVVVAASGNYAGPVLFPAAYDAYCLAVGAGDAHDNLASWSNYGPEVDVIAPGVDVFGARFSPDKPEVLDEYGWDSGTSFSAPYVAGAAALLKSYKPHLSNEYIMKIIMYTSDDMNAAVLPGVDILMGYGRINLSRLLGPYELN